MQMDLVFLGSSRVTRVPSNFDGVLFPSKFAFYIEQSPLRQYFRHCRLNEYLGRPGYIPLGLLGGTANWLGVHNGAPLAPLLSELRTVLAQHRNLKILFDYSWEAAFSKSFFAEMSQFIAAIGIPEERCVILIANSGIELRYTQYLRTNNKPISSSYKVIGADFFLLYSGLEFAPSSRKSYNSQNVTMSQIELGHTEIRRFKFLSLNRRPRWHRFLIALMIEELGMRDQGLISMPSLGFESDWPVEANRMNPFLSQLAPDLSERLLSLQPKTYASLPWTIDIPIDKSGTAEDHAFQLLPSDLLMSSYVQIVSETWMEGDICDVCITEKVCKPLATHHPFIVFGGRGTVARLASYGFHFNFIFNYGSDSDFAIGRRLQGLHENLSTLSKLSFADLHELYYGNLAALHQNYLLLLEMPRVIGRSVVSRLEFELY